MKLPLYLRVLLLLTLISCGWLFWQDTVDSPAPASSPVTTTPQINPTTPASPSAPTLAETVDLFPTQTWTPAPPPIPVDTAPPKPPALPFSVSAQWRYENQSKIVVLRGNDRQYTLCNRCSVPGRIVPGKMLDSHYRLDKLTDTTVVLTYMPLKHVSTLRLDTH
ncbi:hypothetical protein G9Q84_04165 [Pseudomonas sp. P7]|uniref:Lipoprotein n=1 Tax=Pseudomonas sivasensis TaxID=1880678 RepID=A0ABW8E6J4_9PSED|nr:MULTISPECIES: hypothetical protein [Pseudomonas]MBA2922094.1 hypothetical protein [Pseudomonas sivasensis]OYT80578.1 MAG: hypothetical protein CFE48_08490 [Pseudomonas sp. PGPPP2]